MGDIDWEGVHEDLEKLGYYDEEIDKIKKIIEINHWYC